MSNKEKSIAKKERKIKERAEYEKNVMNYNNVVAIELANSRKPKIAPKDSFISIQNINKIYDNLVQAVYDFSLDIKKNEFIVFVGPSGCGKSTILRMIAGLEEITSGNLFIDGQYANSLPPKDRDIAMVFQSYALYPHMSVYDNMAFSMKIKESLVPLLDENGKQKYGVNAEKEKATIKEIEEVNNKLEKYSNIHELEEKANALKGGSKIKYNKLNAKIYGLKQEKEILEKKLEILNKNLCEIQNNFVPLYESRKLSKEEIDERVRSASNILQIDEYLERKPKALSGGQRQRVALGRAICKRAKLFLMDEPLSNLDAKLRVQMRSEIVRLHKTIGATTIYVTHDQTEAMTMADRIVIMKKGVIQQIGTPKEIYNHPANIFVAMFIGSPSMNIIECVIKNNKIIFDDANELKLSKDLVMNLRTKLEEKVNKINDFVNNGLQNEFSNHINVKKEEFKFNQESKGYKYKVDENGNIIDPMKNMQLEDYEKEICENIYKDKLDKALKNKEIYQKMLEANEYKVKFGIRPENIYIKDSYAEGNIQKSNLLKLKISIPELLGNEYFLHSNLANRDFIFKASANNDVKENDCIEVVFDMYKIHIFDIADDDILL